MHLILMTRGIQQSRDIWKQFMCSQMFDWKRKNLNFCECGAHKNIHNTPACLCKEFKPKEEFTLVQGALRPIELWEYVFPQESLQEVLAMQNIHQVYDELRPEVNKIAWLINKATGAKKIPPMPELKKKEAWQITKKYIPIGGMAVYPLGIREDKIEDFTQYGYFQEGL